MAMVISCRSKAVICAFVLLILLCVVLLVGATKGWFLLKKGGLDNDEHVAARTQVKEHHHSSGGSFILRTKSGPFPALFIVLLSTFCQFLRPFTNFSRAKNIFVIFFFSLFSVRNFA